jgi:drug/metabolite transporter (DMT)-like permease
LSAGAPSAKVWAALAVVYVVWGSTYLAIDVGVRTMPPFLMLAARFLVAGGVLYAVVAAREGRLLRPPPLREWRAAFLIGAALLLVGNGTVGWAEDRGVDTGTAAIIIASMPLWLALFDRLLYGRRFTAAVVAGLVVGFAGVAILVSPGVGGATGIGELALVVSSAVWALGSLRARGETASSPLLSAAMQMLAGGALLALAATALGEWNDFEPSQVSAASAAAFVYLVLVGSLLAFSAYTWLLRVAPTSLVGTYAYVNPLIAVMLGTIVLDEGLTWRLLFGGGIVVAAVAVIVSGTRAPRRRALASAPARAK